MSRKQLFSSTRQKTKLVFSSLKAESLIMLYGERIMVGLLQEGMDENRRQKYIYASANFSRRSMRKKFSGLIRQKSNSSRLYSELWKTIPFYNSLNTQNIFFCTLQTRHFRINLYKTQTLQRLHEASLKHESFRRKSNLQEN